MLLNRDVLSIIWDYKYGIEFVEFESDFAVLYLGWSGRLDDDYVYILGTAKKLIGMRIVPDPRKLLLLHELWGSVNN